MGILNRLWATVWRSEEAEKDRRKNAEISQAIQEIHQRYAAPTPVQAACLKQGGPEVEDVPNYPGGFVGGSSANVGSNTYQQTILMAQANANAAMASRALTNVAQAAQSIGMVSGLPGTSGGHTIYTNFPSAFPIRTATPGGAYDSYDHNVYFLALRGIEQASMKKPEGNHRYDDLALGIQDLRNFNEFKEISLIGLASFCLSNVMEVEPIAMLLEGYGMKVV